MKTVYAVNSGLYSDYRVDAIFSTKEKAEEFMGTIKETDFNKIEEYEIDPPVVDLIKRGYSIWVVHMLVDGTVELIRRTEHDTYTISSIGHRIWRRTQAPAYRGKGIPDVLTSKVWAKTEQRAIKIVNEHRTQMIESGQFA